MFFGYIVPTENSFSEWAIQRGHLRSGLNLTDRGIKLANLRDVTVSMTV
jgi:hypothetical protein